MPVLCLLAPFCLVPTVSAAAQTQPSSTAPAPLITRPIDDTRLVELKGNVHPAVRTATDLGPASDTLVLRRMILLLKRSPAQQAALDKLVDSQKNPNSPQYHKWLTPAQFGAQFGVTPQDMSTITGWLQSHGFTVESVANGKNAITFSGTNAQLESAFHTTIHQYRSAPSKAVQTNTAPSAVVPPVNLLHYANATNPSIPEALAPAIAGIVSLNNFPIATQSVVAGLARPQAGSNKWQLTQTVNPAPQFNTSIGTATYHAVSPSDFATIYNVQPLWDAGIDGTGQTIAIVNRSNINPADVDSFRSFFGLPAKRLNVIVNGPDPGLVQGDEGEADVDVEWSGAVAKNATVDLVVSASTAATDGIDLSALYIVDNNLAPIMSTSFGGCEMFLGNGGNQFYNGLWEQAASQGITALVSSGDSGSAACDQNNPNGAAQDGFTVSGLASTPFDTAVGGTDLYGTEINPNAYWSTTNNPTTQQSALGYIQELPWNNGCGNPQLLAILQNFDGVTATTGEALCSSGQENFLGVVGGSGGPSNCTVSDPQTATCISGYPKPTFQTGVPGIPNDSARDLPDVSLFAGNGLWGSFYVFCESDGTPDGQCGFSSGDAEYLAVGGTSVSSPSFAGIIALVEQKTNSIQGNVNYDLYKLAAAQFTAGTSCDSSTVSDGSSCVFYDVASDSQFNLPGSNAVPCLSGYADCTPTNPNDLFSVLPGWNSTPGYDTATGLGTLNAANLVNTWSTASANLTATTTTLALNSASIAYGSTGGTISVADSNGSGSGGAIPDGDVSLTNAPGSTPTLGIGPFTLDSEGSATFATYTLAPGTYSIVGHYAGDATFAASNSAATSLVITQAATTATTIASRTALSTGESVTLSTTIKDISAGLNPTGLVTYTDTANGVTLGSQLVLPATDSNGNSIGTASINIAGKRLSQGNNSIAATYSGDANYVAATAAPVSISYTGPFSLTSASTSVSITSGSSATAALTIAANGAPLPTAVSFSCPAAPAGITCSFSPATIAAGASSGQSTLTINGVFPATSTSNVRRAAVAHNTHAGLLTATGGIALSAMCLMFVAPGKRRRYGCLLLCITAAISLVPLGCNGSSAHTLTATSTTVAATPASGVQGSTFTFMSTVSGSSGTGTPTGTVTFSDGSSTLGMGTVSNGTASFSSTTLALGSHSVVATYSGDTNFAPSNSGTPATADVQYSANLTVAATDSLGNTTSIQIPVTVQ
ncbi:MAG TPA: Ig-like domain repeat protein [Terracidiphilus sp.]|nr:Ig-like domain repeat protein [Terracidiphilus sp.]